MEERIKEMNNVMSAIDSTSNALQTKKQVDWNQMLNLMHLTSKTKSLSVQYKNATNIAARIQLHRDYSVNHEGWFSWLFKNLHLQSGMKVREVGSGNGSLWSQNITKIPQDISVIVSDVSVGMVSDAQEEIGKQSGFDYQVINAEKIPFPDNSFDLVIANHMLFYCDDIGQALSGIKRVLKPSGRLVASTYSEHHMHEITDLVQNFDSDIVLTSTNLYERFVLENGVQIL